MIKTFSQFYFLTIFAVLTAGLSSCENDLAAIPTDIDKDMIAKETARDVKLLYSDSAVVRVRVTGPVMMRHLDKSDPRQEFPEGISVEFLDASGRTQSYLSAKYAMRKENKDEVIVQDSVVWQSKQNERLETEELVWDNKKRKVHSNKFVKITKPGEVVYGYGFEANEDFTVWKIKALEGVIKVDGIEN